MNQRGMMKILPVIFFLIIAFIPWKASSQVYFLNNGFTNGGKVTGCTGTFKDSNPFGNYAKNESYSITFYPTSSPNQVMQIVFDTLDISTGDTMYIYDGPSANAPLLTDLSSRDGAPLTIRATPANTSGSLTIKFVSDGSNEAKGWNARLSCKSACQPINAQVNTIPAADANGFVNICTGQQVTFLGNGVYPLNDKYYHQDDKTTKFLWAFSDGRDTSGINANQLIRKFDSEGGTVVKLTLADQNDCYNLIPVQVKVRTSLKPDFNIPQTPICLYDTLKLIASPKYPKGNFSSLPVNSDSKALPDGKGVCYESSINVTNFLPGQLLTNLNDLEGILVNMEHSWLGDITIAITAPNKAKVFLKKQVGTANDWGAYLGEPVDEPNINSPYYDSIAAMVGKGYDYLFAPKPQYGTMEAERKNYKYTYTDNAGQLQLNHPYLPAGKYTSEENLNGLVGTPLNGLWTLEVCDLYKEDNGYIFYWTIKMNPKTYPNPEEFSRVITNQKWENAVGLISSKDSLALVSPNNPGNFNYKYVVTDNFGCAYDTTITISVNALPLNSGLPSSDILCNGQTLDLSISNLQTGYQYNWSTGAGNVQKITINQPGLYTLKSTNLNGCKIIDTVNVVNSPPISIKLGADTLFCGSNPNQLQPEVTGPVTTFEWSTGATTSSIKLTAAGTYKLTGKTNNGCLTTATITLLQNPVNALALPADTSICFGTSFQYTIKPFAGTTFTWNDGTLNNTKLITGGNYSFSANYKGCEKQDDWQVGIRPLPVVNLGRDTTLCVGFDLPLMVNYSGANYLWSNGSTQNNIVAKTEGLYWVKATLNNCTYSDSLVMKQIKCDCNVKLPNAFSPNGDGLNDYYQPEISCFPKDYNFSVFNRYGQLIYTTKDYNQKWNGTINGNMLPVATYYYILSFYNITSQKTEVRKGGITLLR